MKHLLFFTSAAVMVAMLASCGGNERKKVAEAEQAKTEAFIASQPLKSGVYTASYFDIKGENPRKGPFDGRMIMALDPEESVVYIYENGNRAKINYNIILQSPFEKKDSVWVAFDKENRPVKLALDSVATLSFPRGEQNVAITFDPNPTTEGSASEMKERIVNQLKKK